MQTIRTNLKINASTQYTNTNFKGMCRFNGQTIAAGATGLFRLGCGSDDNGTDISTYFIPLLSDLGEKTEKRAEFLYLGYQADGNLNVSLTGDEKTTIGPYTIETDLTKGQQRRRVKLGRGMAFTYGSFKIENIDGAYFAVDSIQALLSAKSHGVK